MKNGKQNDTIEKKVGDYMIPANLNKAITFSFDDGVTQDKRLIDLLDKYNLKCTFNLNSSLLGKDGHLLRFGKNVDHTKNNPSDVKYIYSNHEVAAHTKTHPFLPNLSKDEIISQVEEDRLSLSDLCGYEVVGMAYPCGGENNDDRVAEIIRENTGIKYARTITSTNSYELQNNLFRFNPSIYHIDIDDMFKLGQEFVDKKFDSLHIFYIWGHSYEFDALDTWERFEEFCKLISNKKDIFYGTNKEVLL